MTDLKCLHCQRRSPNAWRGLCRACYRDPEIRRLYPENARITAPELIPLGPAKEPTQAVTGSAAKIQVLAARYAAQESLWHPDDFGADETGAAIERAAFIQRIG